MKIGTQRCSFHVLVSEDVVNPWVVNVSRVIGNKFDPIG